MRLFAAGSLQRGTHRGSAGLPWVPSTPPSSWVTLLVPRSGFVPPLSPTGGPWRSPAGRRAALGPDAHGDGFWGGVPLTPSPQSCGWAAVPGGVGAGVQRPRHPCLGPTRGQPFSATGRGRGWPKRVPGAPRVTRAPPGPLAAKCCVSSVGVDLRYHLAAALPSRGHRCPRVPAPCRRATGVAAPD